MEGGSTLNRVLGNPLMKGILFVWLVYFLRKGGEGGASQGLVYIHTR